MLKSILSLVAVALLATPALHADPMTGQFSLQGTVTDTGSELQFSAAETSVNTQSGSFATILGENSLTVNGNPIIVYAPSYTPGSEVFTVGGLTIDLETFAKSSSPDPFQNFSGTVLLTAAGYDPTMGIFSLTTQENGAVSFSATAMTTASPVPEPASLLLLGTGLIGVAGAARRRLFN